MSQLILYRGETRVLTVTVTDLATGLKADLSAGTWLPSAIEFQLKGAIEGQDPALISKGIGTGIAILPQTGSTLGKFTITLNAADTSGSGTPPGRYYYDVVGVFATYPRLYLVKPIACAIQGVVNQL